MSKNLENEEKKILEEKMIYEKRRRHRQLVVQEIITTERTYVFQLETLMEVFIKPMKSKGLGLTAKDFRILFSGLFF
jgi:hypothetical protein